MCDVQRCGALWRHSGPSRYLAQRGRAAATAAHVAPVVRAAVVRRTLVSCTFHAFSGSTRCGAAVVRWRAVR